MKEETNAISRQISVLSSFMAQLRPTAKLAEDPEFRGLIMPADSVGGTTMKPDSGVYCVMCGGTLLGVFSSEAAASEYCTRAYTHIIPPQIHSRDIRISLLAFQVWREPQFCAPLLTSQYGSSPICVGTSDVCLTGQLKWQPKHTALGRPQPKRLKRNGQKCGFAPRPRND